MDIKPTQGEQQQSQAFAYNTSPKAASVPNSELFLKACCSNGAGKYQHTANICTPHNSREFM